MRIVSMLAVGVMVLGSGLAWAQGAAVPMPPISMQPGDIIAARQGGMALNATAVVAMKAVVDAGGDVKPLTNAARAMAKWARAERALFPDGTQTGGNTRARPEVWSDRAGYVAISDTLVAAADKLVQMADANDKPGFAAQFAAVTQACTACHRGFRTQ